MNLQDHGSYKLDVRVTWVDSDMLQLKLTRIDDILGEQAVEYYLDPIQLSRLAEYINDTLCL